MHCLYYVLCTHSLKGQCHEMDIFWRFKHFTHYFLCKLWWFSRSLKSFSLPMSCPHLFIRRVNPTARTCTVPEFIDPVFTKTSPQRSLSLIENKRFGLVFAKTGSINSGTVDYPICWYVGPWKIPYHLVPVSCLNRWSCGLPHLLVLWAAQFLCTCGMTHLVDSVGFSVCWPCGFT